MTERLPEDYSPEESKELAEWLKGFDGSLRQQTLPLVASRIVSLVGRVNFAGLESICRENNLRTAFLAVPWTEEMQRANPGMQITRPDNPLVKCPNEALVCESVEDAEYYANMYGVSYSPETNLELLRDAGIMTDITGMNPAARITPNIN